MTYLRSQKSNSVNEQVDRGLQVLAIFIAKRVLAEQTNEKSKRKATEDFEFIEICSKLPRVVMDFDL